MAMEEVADTHDYLMGTDVPAPRAVYSEKELGKAFEELLATLSNKDHDFWQKRCDALRSLRALVLGGAFGSLLVPLRAVLCICWMLTVRPTLP